MSLSDLMNSTIEFLLLVWQSYLVIDFFFFQAEDGIRDVAVTGVQTCALPISQLILADVAMPGRDGYEVCDFVKNSPDHRDVTVLLIFSDADPYNEEQGARVRADGTIRKMAAGKPFIPEELISAVTKYLSKGGRPAPAESTAPAPERTVVTEPVDAEPEVRTRKSLYLGSLPPGSAFSERQEEEPPQFYSG